MKFLLFCSFNLQFIVTVHSICKIFVKFHFFGLTACVMILKSILSVIFGENIDIDLVH